MSFIEFILENIGTIAVLAVILAVVLIVIRKMYIDKKENRSSCGCACSGCPNSALCHPKSK